MDIFDAAFTDLEDSSMNVTVLDPATREVLGEVVPAGPTAARARLRPRAMRLRHGLRSPSSNARATCFATPTHSSARRKNSLLPVSRENGKTIADARAEVRRGIEAVEFACGMPSLMMGDALGDVARGVDCISVRKPLGVCAGGITPFNFPAMISDVDGADRHGRRKHVHSRTVPADAACCGSTMADRARVGRARRRLYRGPRRRGRRSKR